MKNLLKGLVAGAALLGSVAVSAAPLFTMDGPNMAAGQIGYYGYGDARNNKWVASEYADEIAADVDNNGKFELQGTYGANLTAALSTKVKVEFLGAEAGYVNDFIAADGSFHWDKKGTSTAVGASFVTELTAGNLFDFMFESTVRNAGGFTGAVNSVENGKNNDASTYKTVDFFVTKLKDGSWILALDDGGYGGDDDNHDDMVIRISNVPEPATLVLFGLGLAGLGAARRRKA